MIMMHAIGFKATGREPNGDPYDCSFMITFPLQARPSPAEVQRVEQMAMASFRTMHPTGQIEARVEKSYMSAGVNAYA